MPNKHIVGKLSAVWATTTNMGYDDTNKATSELDSHANMIVVGRQATIFSKTGKCADVRPFSSDCSKLESVPIVDAAIAYDCPYTMQTYILTVNNALHVPNMPHNLIPPFIMREAGLLVNDVPRIHTNAGDLNNETHCIVAKEEVNGEDLKIPLKLDGIFSYFETRKLTDDEVEACEYIPTVSLSSDSDKWDPYDPSYANQEDSMIDYRGDLMVREPKKRKILDDSEVSEICVTQERYEAAVSSIVAKNHGDPAEEPAHESNPQDGDSDFIRDDDVIASALAGLSHCWDDDLFCREVNERVGKSKVAMEAGCLDIEDMTDDPSVLEIFSTTADKPRGVTSQQLSKVWRISQDDAKRTLEVTTQLGRSSVDPSLARRFGTNDRMLRY